MSSQVYEMSFGSLSLRYSFLFPQTLYYFVPRPRPVDGDEADVRVPPDRIVLARNFFPPGSSDAYVEYRCLIELTARALLRFHASVFHAVSFVWRDRAWLLTAPSETGKTTQLLNWQRLFPGELTVISGDMPIIEAREDGGVWVHPSFWNGKERYSSRLSAKLGGLVLLRQGEENRIERLTPRDGVAPLLFQFPVIPETEEEIRRLARLEECLLEAAPAFCFVNLGNDASTALLRRTLLDLC